MESVAPDQVAPRVQEVPVASKVRKQGASLKKLIKESTFTKTVVKRTAADDDLTGSF